MSETNEATAERAEASAFPIPRIGEFWAEQGGVNVGLMRNPHGADYWLIAANEPDAVDEYDGRANTSALVVSQHDHPAAEHCAGLTIDGHSDFYLPARRELALVYANAPELLKDDWYWTSTQYSALGAWYQHGTHGGQGSHFEGYEWRVLPVRRFIPSSI